MKPDEQKLMDEMKAHPKEVPLDIVHRLGMNEKRAAYILGKWWHQGIYEYGVNVMFGWLV
jgi:hypothetical protein